MRLNALTLAGAVALVQVAGAAPAGGQTGDAPVEQQVLDELAAEGTTDSWVYLQDRANLGGASRIADRTAQGWFVYEQPTTTAEASQADLVTLLDHTTLVEVTDGQLNLEFNARGSFQEPIVNAIRVTHRPEFG